MNVHETVADIAQQIRGAHQSWPGEWSDAHGPLAWLDDDANRIRISRPAMRRQMVDAVGPHEVDDWRPHPAVLALEGPFLARVPDLVLASWVLDDGALDAVLAAGVDADYARAAHRSGITDAPSLIDCWTNGVPLEYLTAMGATS